MSRFERIKLPRPLVAVLLGAVAACGGAPVETETSGTGEFDRRASSLQVTPTLDLSQLAATSVADRIKVDEILINLAEVRMLSADPRIPAEGVPLLTEDRLITSQGGDTPAIELTFPDYLINDQELAVFMRVGPTEALQGASVVVRGQYQAVGAADQVESQQALLGATDPDVDPMDQPDDPTNDDCATDPDVDPMDCDQTKSTGGALRVAATRPLQTVPFELRDEQVVDLLTTLGVDSNLEVVLSVPATRWLTANTVSELENASVTRTDPATQRPLDETGAESVIFMPALKQGPTSADRLRDPSNTSSGYVLDGSGSVLTNDDINRGR